MRSIATRATPILLTVLATACAAPDLPPMQSNGQIHAFELDAETFFLAEVDQISHDFTVTVTSPDGEVLREVDGRTRGIETIRFETEAAGAYEVAITARDTTDEVGEFRFSVLRSEPVATDPAARLDQLMSPWDGDDRAGAIAAVVEGGEVTHVHAVGMANLSHGIPWQRGTISNIGSVTKQFTAMGVLTLQAQGKMSLDDDIRTHIPELRDFGTPITIRNLLNHTGGYREVYNLLPIGGHQGEDAFARERAISIVQRQPELQALPNTEWNYNNTGYILISLAIERVSGESFADYMRENVFEPLGMVDTRVKMVQGELISGSAQGYTAEAGGGYRTTRDLAASAGAGGVYTTVDDLTRWMLNYRDATVGGAEAIEAITTTAVLESGDSTGYGLGLGLGEQRGRTLYSHTGGDISHRAYLSYYPELESGVIVMSNNAAFDLTLGGEIGEMFLAEHFDEEEEEDEAETDADEAADEDAGMSDARKEAITGDWSLEVQGISLAMSVALEDGDVFVDVQGQGRSVARPTSDSTLELASVSAEFTFDFEADGTTSTGTLVQSGLEISMRRVDRAGPGEEYLGAYVGRYYSQELETFYDVAVEDGGLVLHHIEMAEPLAMQHTDGDEFSTAVIYLNTIAFERSVAGSVTGFTVSNGRTKGVRFGKM
ncbi:MAG: serine hydrolase [Gemmatimonadetes bacterium]|nr:serine hydrolase [Gemmatimonadota bacterium]